MTLADRLRSDAPDERRVAIAEIAARTAVDTGELESLVACLGHPAKAIQRPAADAFRALAEQGIAVEALLTTALDAPDPRLRFGAAYALARLGPPPPAASSTSPQAPPPRRSGTPAPHRQRPPRSAARPAPPR